MKVNREDIKVRYKDPESMPHLGQDAKHYAYAATWTLEAMRKYRIVGCPAGTGQSEAHAIRDLLKRTNAESRLELTL